MIHVSPELSTKPVKDSSSVIEIKLLGQRIVLKTSETNPQEIQNILELVSSRLSLAEARSKGAAAHHITLLALLDLAEEYVKAKKRTADFKREVDDQSSKLLNLVEAEYR